MDFMTARRTALGLTTLAMLAGLVAVPPAAQAADPPAITVASPAAGDVVSSPVTITGTAHTFESSVYFRIRDQRGAEVSSGYAMAGAQGYSVTLPYLIVGDQPGTVEVFEYSAKGDDPVPAELSKVIVPVQLTARTQDRIAVFAPTAGQRVFSPVRLTGKARVFEGTVHYRIRDQRGTEIATGRTTAVNDGDEQDIFRGTFTVDVPFKVRTRQPGTIELYEANMSDEGPRELSLVKVPVSLSR
jgi:hypothetical protein